ncbi:MAG TPA: hypothetical protein VJ417_06935, partial [Candidatus Glassbacteria bacterium]|nr:hypothetical protein [Candidatus Glassbacteria bacterium]
RPVFLRCFVRYCWLAISPVAVGAWSGRKDTASQPDPLVKADGQIMTIRSIPLASRSGKRFFFAGFSLKARLKIRKIRI